MWRADNARAARSEQRVQRATNLTLTQSLVTEAKRLGANVSQACAAGRQERVAEVRRQRCVAENREAMDIQNARIERNGLALARYRRFRSRGLICMPGSVLARVMWSMSRPIGLAAQGGIAGRSAGRDNAHVRCTINGALTAIFWTVLGGIERRRSAR